MILGVSLGFPRVFQVLKTMSEVAIRSWSNFSGHGDEAKVKASRIAMNTWHQNGYSKLALEHCHITCFKLTYDSYVTFSEQHLVLIVFIICLYVFYYFNVSKVIIAFNTCVVRCRSLISVWWDEPFCQCISQQRARIAYKLIRSWKLVVHCCATVGSR